MLPSVGAVVCLLALARSGSGAESAGSWGLRRRVLEVPAHSEPVHSDGSDDLGFSVETESTAVRAGVSRLWGVADTTAPVGRLFVHTIDRHAFSGAVQRYQVSGGGGSGDPLPSWMTFDPERATFAGVPTEGDLHPHRVAVRALGKDGSVARDVFMVDVLSEPEKNGLPGSTGFASDLDEDLDICRDHDASTFGAVYFDFAAETLGGSERLSLLTSLAEELQLSPESILMTSQRADIPLDNPSTLEAGAGVRPRTGRHLTKLSWKVGCGDVLEPGRRRSVELLRVDQQLQQLSKALGRPAVGWTLTSERSAHRRRRRQVDGSGDETYDSYDDEDQYDNYKDGKAVLNQDNPSIDDEEHGDFYNDYEEDYGPEDYSYYDESTLPGPGRTDTITTAAPTSATTPRASAGSNSADGTEDPGRGLEEVYDYYDEEEEEEDEEDGWPVPGERVVPSLVSPAFSPPPTSPVYPPPRVTARPQLSRISTPIPVAVVPTVYRPGTLEPSRVVEETPPMSARPDTVHLESSMAVTSTVSQASAAAPRLKLTSPTVAPPLLAVSPSVAPPVLTASPALPNQQPRLQRPLPVLSAVAGKPFWEWVPEDTFSDLEDGETPDLGLRLEDPASGPGVPPPAAGWIQLDRQQQRLYGLPLETDVGSFSYTLTATDSDGDSASTDVSLIVKRNPLLAEHGLNHRVFMDLKMYSADEFPNKVDWLLLVVGRLARLFGETVTSTSVVLDRVRTEPGQPLQLVWANDTLSTETCDVEQLERIQQLLENKDGSPTPHIQKAMAPDFRVSRVHMELTGNCIIPPSSPPPVLPSATTTVPTEGTTEPSEKPATESATEPTVVVDPPPPPPVLARPLEPLVVSAGHLLQVQLPSDMFGGGSVVHEEDHLSQLALRLLTADRRQLPPTSWLQLDLNRRQLVGLPLDKDARRDRYFLVCEDRVGQTAEAELEVTVTPRPAAAVKLPPAAEFQLTLDQNYRAFMRQPLRRVRLVRAIAVVFGDADASAVQVDSIRPGSVVVTWLNASLPTDTCAEQEVRRLHAALVDDSGALTAGARARLEPEFRVRSVRVTPGGACLPVMATDGGNGTRTDAAGGTEEDGYLLTFLIPAVVIAALLLIALVIACVLYRARRRGKMTMTDSGTYVSRGVPVIFADELEERVDRREARPVVLSNEKPPAPPAYHSAAAPLLDGRGQASGDGDGDAPYERPPPVAAPATAAAAARPGRQTANSRQPPPYVPP